MMKIPVGSYVHKKFQTDAKSLGGDGAVPDVDIAQEISSDEEALSSKPLGEFGPPATPEKIPERIRTDRASSPIEEVTLSAMEKKGRGRGKESQKGQGSKKKKKELLLLLSKPGRYQTASMISRQKAGYCKLCGEELNDDERYLGVWNTHRVSRWTFRNDFDLYLCCCSDVWVEGGPWSEYTVKHPVRQGKWITGTRRNP